MRYIAAAIYIGGRMDWQFMGDFGNNADEPGLQISFPFYSNMSEYEIFKLLKNTLKKNNVNWIFRDESGWKINAAAMVADFPDLLNDDWFKGVITPVVSIEHKRKRVFDKEEDRTYCKFIVTPEIVSDQMSKKIFLSHKGVNKPLVRRVKKALEAINAEPWLDEDAMRAGVELERGILKGFEDSCAAVFFITPEFKDENYLASEVNYAIMQKRAKNDRFSIITLVFENDNDQSATVPKLLSPYVYKKCTNELEALTEIIYALPIKIGDLGWR